MLLAPRSGCDLIDTEQRNFYSFLVSHKIVEMIWFQRDCHPVAVVMGKTLEIFSARSVTLTFGV